MNVSGRQCVRSHRWYIWTRANWEIEGANRESGLWITRELACPVLGS